MFVTRGVDLYDYFYAEKNKGSLKRDSNIVLIQVEDSRKSIAEQINIIEKYNPLVLAMDVVFEDRKDSISDIELVKSIRASNNIVLAYRNAQSKTALRSGSNFFDTSNSSQNSGYMNLISDKYSVVRYYAPFRYGIGNKEFSFTSRIIQLTSPLQLEKLKRRAYTIETINYSGNIGNYTTLSKEELRKYDKEQQLRLILEGKIVLLGYFVKTPPLRHEDLYISPINNQAGKNIEPDMYGVVIHANILSMVLNDEYPKHSLPLMSWLFAGFLSFLLLLFLINLQAEKDLPSYPKIFLIQLFFIFFVMYFFLKIYDLSSWKVPLLPLIISLLMVATSLHLYKKLALWLYEKVNYRTVFSSK